MTTAEPIDPVQAIAEAYEALQASDAELRPRIVSPTLLPRALAENARLRRKLGEAEEQRDAAVDAKTTYGQALAAAEEQLGRLRADDLAIRRVLRDRGGSVGGVDPLPSVVAEILDAMQSGLDTLERLRCDVVMAVCAEDDDEERTDAEVVERVRHLVEARERVDPTSAKAWAVQVCEEFGIESEAGYLSYRLAAIWGWMRDRVANLETAGAIKAELAQKANAAEERYTRLAGEVERIASNLDAFPAGEASPQANARALRKALAATAPQTAPGATLADELAETLALADEAVASITPEHIEQRLAEVKTAPSSTESHEPAPSAGWYPIACEHGYDHCPVCDKGQPIPPLEADQPSTPDGPEGADGRERCATCDGYEERLPKIVADIFRELRADLATAQRERDEARRQLDAYGHTPEVVPALHEALVDAGFEAPADPAALTTWVVTEMARLVRVNREWEALFGALVDGLAERQVPVKLGRQYTRTALDEIDRLRALLDTSQADSEGGGV